MVSNKIKCLENKNKSNLLSSDIVNSLPITTTFSRNSLETL